MSAVRLPVLQSAFDHFRIGATLRLSHWHYGQLAFDALSHSKRSNHSLCLGCSVPAFCSPREMTPKLGNYSTNRSSTRRNSSIRSFWRLERLSARLLRSYFWDVGVTRSSRTWRRCETTRTRRWMRCSQWSTTARSSFSMQSRSSATFFSEITESLARGDCGEKCWSDWGERRKPRKFC